MFEPSKSPIKASTQEHLEIEDIRDDVVILKDGSAVIILSTTAINFGLLSEREQDATIYAYASLLNSLTFSIQILIRSKKKDISGYLKLLSQAEIRETKKKIRDQISKYKVFIQDIVAKNEVLDKKFFLIIPMGALEVGAAQSFGSSLGRKKGLPFPKEFILEKAKNNLGPKRDHLIKLLGRLGLRGHQLTTQELIQLFYEIYNPEAGTQPVGQKAEYQAPIVQAAKVITSEQAENSRPQTISQPQTNQASNSVQSDVSNLVKEST